MDWNPTNTFLFQTHGFNFLGPRPQTSLEAGLGPNPMHEHVAKNHHWLPSFHDTDPAEIGPVLALEIQA